MSGGLAGFIQERCLHAGAQATRRPSAESKRKPEARGRRRSCTGILACPLAWNAEAALADCRTSLVGDSRGRAPPRVREKQISRGGSPTPQPAGSEELSMGVHLDASEVAQVSVHGGVAPASPLASANLRFRTQAPATSTDRPSGWLNDDSAKQGSAKRRGRRRSQYSLPRSSPLVHRPCLRLGVRYSLVYRSSAPIYETWCDSP
jgi:hypothetical protein